MTDELSSTYTLICENCGNTYDSDDRFPHPQLCPTCRAPQPETCPTCKGLMADTNVPRNANGSFQPCEACHGTGKVAPKPLDEQELREKIDELTRSDEEFWLIERKPHSSIEPEGNKFFTGREWSSSALEAARFKTKADAENVMSYLVVGSSAFGTPQNLCCQGAFVVSHMWSAMPRSKEILNLIKRAQKPPVKEGK